MSQWDMKSASLSKYDWLNYIFFQLGCIVKGAKLVEVDPPGEDTYICTLAYNLTDKSDT